MKIHLKTQKYINASNLLNHEIDTVLELHQKYAVSIKLLITWVRQINKNLRINKDLQLSEILQILIFVKKNKIQNKIKAVFTFLKNGLTIEQCYWCLRCTDIKNVTISKLVKWTKNLNRGQVYFDCELSFISRIIKISRLGRDSMNAESLVLRYGESLGAIMYSSRREDASYSKEKVAKLKGKEYADAAFKNRAFSLEIFITKYGEKEGLERWEKYKSKRKATYSKNKNAGRDYNSFSLKTYINKYGETEGLKNWQNMREKCIKHGSKEHLREIYGDEAAEKMAKNRWGIVSLNAFVKRHGEEEGTKRYNAFIEKQKSNQNLEYLIEKYGEEEGYKKYVKVAWKSNKTSDISLKFFKLLEEHEIYFDLESPIFLNGEERKLLGQKIVFVDGKSDNLIIEFFGDIWHANPKLFEVSACPNPFSDMTSEEIRLRDEKRISILENKGFKVLIIWEHDFKSNEELIIANTIEWIKRNRNTHEISENCQD